MTERPKGALYRPSGLLMCQRRVESLERALEAIAGRNHAGTMTGYQARLALYGKEAADEQRRTALEDRTDG